MTKIDKHAGWVNVELVARFRKVPQALGRQKQDQASWVNIITEIETAIDILDLND